MYEIMTTYVRDAWSVRPYVRDSIALRHLEIDNIMVVSAQQSA